MQVNYVKRVIEEADGIQPHLVAPEAGYRRLLEEALGYLREPSEKSVEEVGRPGGRPSCLVFLFFVFTVCFSAWIMLTQTLFVGQSMERGRSQDGSCPWGRPLHGWISAALHPKRAARRFCTIGALSLLCWLAGCSKRLGLAGAGGGKRPPRHCRARPGPKISPNPSC